jgi:hypothetical protein
MKFFHTMWDSIYNPAFYQATKYAGASSAFKNFLLLVFVVSLATTASLGFSFWQWVSSTDDLRTFRETALSTYPDELVLEYRDGHVTSNVEEPYFIALPKKFQEGAAATSGERAPANLIVIDTTHTVSPDDFRRYDTAVILGSDAFWINDTRKGKIEIQTFDNWSKAPFTIDKKKVTGYADRLAVVLKPVIIAFFVILPFLLFGIFSVGYLLYLIFGACVIWIVAKLRKTDLTYGQSYRLGLSLLTLPILYGLLSTFVPALGVPFLFTLILAIVTYLNLAPIGSDRSAGTDGTSPIGAVGAEQPAPPGNITENSRKKEGHGKAPTHPKVSIPSEGDSGISS